MNELKLYESNDKALDFQYEVFAPEKSLAGTYNNNIEIKFSECESEDFEDDFDDEFDDDFFEDEDDSEE